MGWLDGGLWLHHTVHVSEDGARDALTLIAPCDCGTGCVYVLIDTETDPLAILADLRTTSGRVPHGAANFVGCGSLRPIWRS
ncbi:hypothetical protein [Streptomyces cadmiisoli]|uniref:hypothetical protein n=1 Tax=Streptomyces cadmiisoli TaxID=2184053 RepID=UPI00364C3F00